MCLWISDDTGNCMIISTTNSASTITLSELQARYDNAIGQDDIIVVPDGVTLILDQDAAVGGIVVKGKLTASDSRDLDLASDWIAVIGGGHLEIGTETQAYQHDFTLTLTGDNPNQDIDISAIMAQAGHPLPLASPPMALTDQDSFLMVMGKGSRLDLHGADASKTSWTQLDGTVGPGATSLTLDDVTGWEAGDRIAITSTDFDMNQAEEVTVTAVSVDGRTISFNPPLEHAHYGEIERYDDPDGDKHVLDMRAEVALVNRNIKIQGDVTWDSSKVVTEQADQYGGHTMIMEGAEMYVSGAEFAYMGQAGLLGKYPLHWHQLDDVSGQYIRDSSIHHTFNKGITIHDTDGAEVTRNVVFENSGHSYFFEDGTESGNVLTDNLGFGTRAPLRANIVPGQDQDFHNPSTFWMKHASNTLIGNHAAGSESTGLMWATFLNDEAVIDFSGFVAEDNVAHSSTRYGAYVGRGFFGRDENPRGSAQEPSKFVPWEIDGLTVYKTELGINLHGTNGTVTNATLAENAFGTRLDSNNRIKDSLIVGETGNTGNPETPPEIAAGRSLPKFGVYNGSKLHEGGSAYENVLYANLPESRGAAFIPSRVEFPYTTIKHSSQSTVEGVTFDNVGDRVNFEIYPGNNFEPNQLSLGLNDLDGSLTGAPGATVFTEAVGLPTSGAFNATERHDVIKDWHAIVSYDGNFGTVRIDKAATPATNDGRVIDDPAMRGLKATRDDGAYLGGLTTTIPVQIGRTYELDYTGVDAAFRIMTYDFGWGEDVVLNLGRAPLSARFTIDDPYSAASWAVREVSSMMMLEASPDTAVFRDANGDVHIKLVAQMAHGELWEQPGNDYSGELHSGVTILVDTRAGIDPDALVFDDPEQGETLAPAPYPIGVQPDPVPVPLPDPEPDPVADPVPDPDPEPTPQPDPSPEPTPDPTPDPDGALIAGTQGNDTLNGAAGSDTLYGRMGDDRIVAGAGDDSVFGGAGTDDLNAGDGADVVRGGSGADRADGGAAEDMIFGGLGTDQLSGGTGDDVIFGNADADTISGGSGEDMLDGGAGEDRLDGGQGNDQLRGGSQSDVFVYAPSGDVDTILDFRHGLDVLDLTSFGFASASEALALASDRGSNLAFDFGDGDELIVLGADHTRMAGDLLL